MIDGQDRVTVSKERRQILKLKQGRSTAIIERPGPVQLSVVRAGLQVRRDIPSTQPMKCWQGGERGAKRVSSQGIGAKQLWCC